MKKDDTELIKRVFRAQQEHTTSGDFIDLVRKDMELIGEPYSEENIMKQSKEEFKAHVKKKVNKAALKYLQDMQLGH